VARLDRFLEVMRVHGGDALRLNAGHPVRMELRGALRSVSREPLDGQQVDALIRELAPPAMVPLLRPSAELTFTYEGPTGPVDVALAPDNGGSAAVLRFRPAARAAATSEPPGPSAEVLAEARKELEALVRVLAERQGSDLHLRVGQPPLLRVDGALVRLERPALEAGPLEHLLLSIMPTMVAARWRQTWDADWAWELEGVARFRCNAGRDRAGPMAVIRLVPSRIQSADDLGLSAEVQRLTDLSKGLVLVTGPTGSGKSTTLAALVDRINRTREDHILTIEDPIEFVHQSRKGLVTQREVGTHTRSFAEALRAALREDPDVVLVGELRDLETIATALETAETGHLVLGTLHTTTAAGAVDRIIDQFPPDQQAQVRVMLSETLRGVVAQVLCRRMGGGRVAAREVLLSTPAIANLIREGKTFQIPTVMQTGRRTGMVTLSDALLDLVDTAQIEPAEAYFKAADKPAVLAALRARGHSTDFVSQT